MTTRRRLARLWWRFRRPTLGRLVVASLALHLALVVVLLQPGVISWAPPPPVPEPVVVELPAAAPGRPLVRPEAPTPAPRPTPPAAARPAPPAPPPAPAPVRPTPAPEPPPAARAPEPPPAPAPPAASESIAPPTPPVVAARPPEAVEPAVPPPPPAPEATPAPAESPLAGRGFSLLRPRIEAPPLPGPSLPGGGTRPEGEGAGDVGRDLEGQARVPLDTPDPRYAEYFLAIKRGIEANWVYPQEAARKGQSGQGLVGFVLRKDGMVQDLQILRSSGVDILDRYLITAIRLAQPFPPIPDRIGRDGIPVALTFTYVLDHGVRIFGFR